LPSPHRCRYRWADCSVNRTMICEELSMKRILTTVLCAVFIVPSALCQCAIRPIKPIPPLGCKDLPPQCASDSAGHGYWTWNCVPSGDSKENGSWKSTTSPSVTPTDQLPSLLKYPL
jgi:hypothetical protein